jgi:hypothetical protein
MFKDCTVGVFRMEDFPEETATGSFLPESFTRSCQFRVCPFGVLRLGACLARNLFPASFWSIVVLFYIPDCHTSREFVLKYK